MITILIMEDQAELAAYWREDLEEAGYNVLHVSNFEEAVAVLEIRDVNVVVSDMLIRDDDNRPSKTGGLSLLSHLRLHSDPQPKTIAVSGAHPQLNILRHAELLQADACIVKPFTSQELVEKVKELLGNNKP